MTTDKKSLAADVLAYELRRIATTILASTGQRGTSSAPQAGPLALRIAYAFDLREVDVDIALAVLGSEIDEDFGALLFHQISRSELAVVSALYPRLEDRLSVADSVGADAPCVARGLLRRTVCDGVGSLASTRRFRSAVFGRPLLSALPAFARLIVNEPQAAPWVTPQTHLLRAMSVTNGSSLCVTSGQTGVGKTTWACHTSFSIGGSVLLVDAARARRTSSDFVIELRELLEDATLLGVPIVIDNASGLLGKNSPLTLLVEDILSSSPARLFVVANQRDEVHESLLTRALARVHIEPPHAAARYELWCGSSLSESMRRKLANDLVLTPRQIANANALIRSGAEPSIAAFGQLMDSQGAARVASDELELKSSDETIADAGR